jgi:AraC-like DNA-binding protein
MTKFNHATPFNTEHWQPELVGDFPVWKGALREQSDAEITALHYHDSLELGYCYEGAGIFVIEDQVYRFMAGDACLIHRGRVHLAQSMKGTTSKWRFLLLDAASLMSDFSTELQQMFAQWQLQGRSDIVHAASHMKLANIVKEIIEETNQEAAQYQQLVKLKLGELLLQSMRIDAEQTPRLRHFDEKAFQRILPAIATILRNYAEQIKIESLAEQCNLSPTQFRRLFALAMDTSPQSYLIDIRLTHADQLLQTTKLKIVDIAAQVGFTTLSSFNRAYQLSRQRSPSKMRSLNNTDPNSTANAN